MENACPPIAEQPWHSTGPIASFGEWADQVAQSYTALTVTPTNNAARDQAFRGMIAACDLGRDTTLSQITAHPQKVRRRKDDIRTSPSESVFINIQISGLCRVSQAGLSTLQKPGSAVLLDARRPFSMQFDGTFRQYCLHLPLQHLDAALPDLTNAAGRVLGQDQPHMVRLFRGITQTGTPRLADLIAMLQGCFSDPVDQRLSDAHLALILHFIRARCADRDLTVTRVARRFGVSKRYVHRLFARTGVSFSQYLLQVRLAAAQRRIASGEVTRISLLADQCGFATASHFSRSYKAAFGVSPSIATGAQARATRKVTRVAPISK